jgi:hypothetical protein
MAERMGFSRNGRRTAALAGMWKWGEALVCELEGLGW